nr:hypothetical protein [Angustibacter aerolatus]
MSASACTATTRATPSLARALEAGIGRIVVDSLGEIDRLADAAAARGLRAPVLLRVTVGVEAHTHSYIATAHEDQKFGLSLSEGVAAEAVRRVLARPELEPARPALAHRLADLRRAGLRGRRPAGAAAARRGGPRPRRRAARGSTSAAASASPTRPSTTRCPRPSLAAGMAEIIGTECAEPWRRRAAHLGRAGAGHRRAEHLHAVPRRHHEGRRARRRRHPALRGGRRRHERQHPHRPVRRGLLGDARRPRLGRRAGAVARGRQALRERRRRGQGRVPAGRHRARRPAGGARYGRLLPQHGQPVQPRAAPAGAGGPRRRGARAAAPRDRGRPARPRRRVAGRPPAPGAPVRIMEG